MVGDRDRQIHNRYINIDLLVSVYSHCAFLCVFPVLLTEKVCYY